jgi:transposase-like protein
MHEEQYLIAAPSRRCGSTKLRKKGHTATGQQTFHCKDCNRYGTLATQDTARAHQRAMVDTLHWERLSQRALARATGMSRTTIRGMLKKVLTP